MANNNEVEALDPDFTAKVTSAVSPWILQQRWCPTGYQDLHPVVLWRLPSKGEENAHALLLVARLDENGPLLQVPLVAAAESANPSSATLVATTEDGSLWDGTVEPLFWKAWVHVASVLAGTRAELAQSAANVRPLGMEQSNSSVILAGGATRLIAKVFRVLQPGVHPEVELPTALTETGWSGVPKLYATWDLPPLPDDLGGFPYCSAVVSQMITGATDGFDLFVDLATKGEDPSREATALGILTAQMHGGLRSALGSGTPFLPADLAERVEGGLKRASLDDMSWPHADLRKRLTQVLADNMGGLITSIETQQIHGDLHLGQTLRSPDGSWYVLDFEGEPLADIAQRSAPDTPLRDIAGMLRSFDYAWQRANDGPDTTKWTNNARDAFLRGYSSESALTDADLVILGVLEIEKALYEVEYEAKYRPDYLRVPLAALEVLANLHGEQSKVRDLKL